MEGDDTAASFPMPRLDGEATQPQASSTNTDPKIEEIIDVRPDMNIKDPSKPKAYKGNSTSNSSEPLPQSPSESFTQSPSSGQHAVHPTATGSISRPQATTTSSTIPPPPPADATFNGDSDAGLNANQGDPLILVGLRVKVDGVMHRPELNGRLGSVIKYIQSKDRYGIRIDGMTKVLSFKRVHLCVQLEID